MSTSSRSRSGNCMQRITKAFSALPRCNILDIERTLLIRVSTRAQFGSSSATGSTQLTQYAVLRRSYHLTHCYRRAESTFRTKGGVTPHCEPSSHSNIFNSNIIKIYLWLRKSTHCLNTLMTHGNKFQSPE